MICPVNLARFQMKAGIQISFTVLKGAMVQQEHTGQI